MYIERSIKKQVLELKKGFPVIVITGPRQSGKTTFLQHSFPKYKYFNLEDPTTLQIIKDDPVTFFYENSSKIIIDEVQRFPELLSYIQVLVDKRQEMGSVFLSGSQNLLLSEKVSQTLAGRAAYQTVLPFSFEELSNNNILSADRFGQMLKGGYPSIYTRRVTPEMYFKQYISTYTERDIRQLRNIGDLSQFQKFMLLLAGRVGQLLNVSSLASDTGISPNTAEDWISILEASYVVFRLQSYYKNVGKRLIKSPKIYFYDTGLLTTLLKIGNKEILKNHYLVGNIFENFIITELVREINNKSISTQLYFFRDSHGNEVDLIIDYGERQVPVEIKLSASYSFEFLKGLDYWNDTMKSNGEKYVIYGGKDKHKINGTMVLSWLDIGKIF